MLKYCSLLAKAFTDVNLYQIIVSKKYNIGFFYYKNKFCFIWEGF